MRIEEEDYYWTDEKIKEFADTMSTDEIDIFMRLMVFLTMQRGDQKKFVELLYAKADKIAESLQKDNDELEKRKDKLAKELTWYKQELEREKARFKSKYGDIEK